MAELLRRPAAASTWPVRIAFVRTDPDRRLAPSLAELVGSSSFVDLSVKAIPEFASEAAPALQRPRYELEASDAAGGS
jgi:hypothetical protein